MRISTLTVIIIGAAVSQGCIQSSVCPQNVSDYNGDILTVSGIQDISLLERTQENALIAVNELTPVKIDALELHVNLRFSAQQQNNQTASWNLLDVFFKPAMACSPLPGYVNSQLTGLSLISNRSFGSNYQPGEPLDTLFFAEEITSFDFDGIFVDTPDSRMLSEYTRGNPATPGAGYAIKLLNTADRPQFDITELHRFTFSLELANGELYDMDSAPVLLSSVSE